MVIGYNFVPGALFRKIEFNTPSEESLSIGDTIYVPKNHELLGEYDFNSLKEHEPSLAEEIIRKAPIGTARVYITSL